MEKLKCVINRDTDIGAFLHVKKMVEDLYTNDSRYINSIVVLGYNLGKNINFYREKFPGKKIIIYQLEQLFNYNLNWFNPNSKHKFVLERTKHIKKWLDECDEIWEYDLSNKWFLENIGYKNITYKPLKYTKTLELLKNKDNPKYDILFYGSVNKKRFDILKKINSKFNLIIVGDYYNISDEDIKNANLNFIPKNFNEKLDDLISDSKIVLNLHFYDSLIQEQVRLFYLLINNKCVISEKSKKNYFGDLIHEFEDYNSLENLINHLLLNNKWREVSKNISSKYKNRDLNNIKIGAIYNSFYNVDLLKKSIESIINVVDYICVIHQKKSFSGEIESSNNQYILNELLDSKYIHEVIFYDKEPKDKIDGMIDKRNMGLQKCRDSNCEYIITLDNDECYNDRKIREEVINMKKNNIDTLYSPIVSYYKNDKYYFFEEKLYVPSIYKIDDRNYRRFVNSSLLCDPARKMTEKKYKVSNMFMHHLTFLENNFKEKINSKILFSVDKSKKNFSVEILKYLEKWKYGEKALIIGNNKNNENELKYVEVHFLNKNVNEYEVSDKLSFEKTNILVSNKQLSIIIPTFNNVDFLTECFNSIILSIKDLDCEILVGIDGCNETLNYLNNKQFDKRFKFYFFEKNIGPYVIKNTLVTKSSSKNILFFDSDDIMLEDMVPEALHVLSKNKFYKPMYVDFKNKNDVKVTSLSKSNKYGEGVFAIDRDTFLSFNGFEGWRCAADSDLMGRLYYKNISFSFGKMVSFLRRIHPNSLTVKPETNYSSKMRAHYFGLSKKKRPNGICNILSTSECKPITITYVKDPIQEKFEERKKEIDIVLGSILNLKNKKPETGVDYGKINEIISKQGVYNVNSSIKPVRQNTPKDRNQLMNLKKGSMADQVTKMLPGKPNRRSDVPNIFSSRRKN